MSKENYGLISKEIDTQISTYLSSNVKGFEKAFVMSSAISLLREKLTPEYMRPIMALQGSRLGFLTDKDIDTKTKKKMDGYPEEVVKDCVIDAVLLGLEVTGNQFNIIGGNMYPTREGFGALLDKMSTLRKNFTYKNILQVAGSKVANVIVEITWQIGLESPKKQVIDFPIKNSEYTSYDALVGKAERKAKRWLYNTIKGTDISDGDIHDIPHVEVMEKKEAEDNIKLNAIIEFLEDDKIVISEDDRIILNQIVSEKDAARYDKAISLLEKASKK